MDHEVLQPRGCAFEGSDRRCFHMGYKGPNLGFQNEWYVYGAKLGLLVLNVLHVVLQGVSLIAGNARRPGRGEPHLLVFLTRQVVHLLIKIQRLDPETSSYKDPQGTQNIRNRNY